ncbi:hypothetical protein [Phenylobacterium sp.]|uniref:hypothetical protein n=1 Tax=Phenylobacterium sp. TaxID=1871053 RepID=UPI0035AEFD79
MTWRRTACALGLAVVVAGPAWADDCAKAFRFEPDARLSVSAIGRLAAESMDSSLKTPLGGVIVVWPFDDEDQPAKGAWVAYAVIYATQGDEGETKPGGVLWADPRLDLYASLSAKTVRTPHGIKMTLEQESLSKACPGGYAILLDDDGVLTVNGARIGQIR